MCARGTAGGQWKYGLDGDDFCRGEAVGPGADGVREDGKTRRHARALARENGREIQDEIRRTVPAHLRGARPLVSLKMERLIGVPFARASGM